MVQEAATSSSHREGEVLPVGGLTKAVLKSVVTEDLLMGDRLENLESAPWEDIGIYSLIFIAYRVNFLFRLIRVYAGVRGSDAPSGMMEGLKCDPPLGKTVLIVVEDMVKVG